MMELEKLLNEVYTEGYKDGEVSGRSQNWTWTAPYINSTPYYRDAVCTDSTTAVNNDKEKNIDKLTCTNDVTSPNIEKKNLPMGYSINLDSGDVRSLSKAVNEIIANASRGVCPSTGTLNAFDALAKELNF
jgi:hypothetical protein